jgi:hypothetical protein
MLFYGCHFSIVVIQWVACDLVLTRWVGRNHHRYHLLLQLHHPPQSRHRSLTSIPSFKIFAFGMATSMQLSVKSWMEKKTSTTTMMGVTMTEKDDNGDDKLGDIESGKI